MPIPDFVEPTGYLPAGRHRCSWSELTNRFTWNEHRSLLADQLLAALHILRVAGCSRVWVNGSYVTDKELPGDVDVLWSAQGVQPHLLDPTFRQESGAAIEDRRKRFGGDYFPIFGPNLEFEERRLSSNADHFPIYEDPFSEVMLNIFQTDRSEIPKGILDLELSTLPKET